MMTLHEFADVAQPLLSALGNAAWQGGIALLVALLTCRFWPRLPGAWQCFILRLALAKLLLTLIPLGPVLLPFLVQPADPATSTPAKANPVVPPASASPARPAPRLEPQPLPPVAPPAPRETPSVASSFRTRFTVALALLYIAGVLTTLNRAVSSFMHLRRLRRTASPAPPPVQQQSDALAYRMSIRRAPLVCLVPALPSPLLMPGAILVPNRSWEPDALQVILAHELAHVRRRDLFWDMLSLLARILFFFHPLVVWAWREERITRELAADTLALSFTKAPAADYGKLLLSLSVSTPQHADYVGAVGAIESGASLTRRLLALKEVPLVTLPHRLLIVLLPLALIPFLAPWRISRDDNATAVSFKKPSLVHLFAGTSHLTVTVKDLSGVPIPNLSVDLYRVIPKSEGALEKTEDIRTWQRTGSDGALQFDGLRTGRYVVAVRSSDHAWPRTYASVTLTDSATRHLSLSLGEGTLITGHVTNRNTGQPVSGVLVEMTVPHLKSAAMPLSPGDLAPTDAQGNYTLRAPVGEAFVTIGHQVVPYSSDGLLSQHQKVTSERDNSHQVCDFTVSPPWFLTFIDEEGNPVSGADVSISFPEPFVAGNNGLRIRSSGTVRLTDFETNPGNTVPLITSKGIYNVIKGDARAHGTFETRPDGSLVVTQDGVAGGAARREPNGQARLVMARSHAAFVGRVVDEEGYPIAYARIHAAAYDRQSRYSGKDSTAWSQRDGTFRVPLLLGYEYTPYVRANGYNQVQVFRENHIPLLYDGHTPKQGETFDLGTITLKKAEGTLNGRVLDRQGKPRPGVLVAIQGRKTAWSQTVTDERGQFHFANLMEGEPLKITVGGDGNAPDTGKPLYQTHGYWYRTGIRAGQEDFQVTLRLAEKDKTLPASAR